MALFMLLDPWLDGVGGHNYQYACDILHAAREQGFEIMLAANARFSAESTPRDWRVRTPFHYDASSRYWLGPDGKCQHPLSIDGGRLPLDEPPQNGLVRIARSLGTFTDWRAADRRRRIENYATGVAAAFDNLKVGHDDVIFLPSLSEFDFLGLVSYLKDSPTSTRATWNLQFHFDVFAGRPHEYATQEERRRRFQRQFTAALAAVPHHHLKFYATTERIADQYNRLGIGTFQPLPYPVSRDIEPPAMPFHDGPLRVTCAGAVRREKGRVALAKLIREVADDERASRRLQLIIHADHRAMRRIIPPELAQQTKLLSRPDANCRQHIVPIRFPLPREDYQQLIRLADVGLFLYDARRYQARCSGVLVEMLAAGVPVIVPAGCWLSDQIAEPNYAHLDALLERTGEAHVACTDNEASLLPPADARAAIVRVFPHDAGDDLTQLRVTARQFDESGDPRESGEPLAAPWVAVLGPRGDKGPRSTLVRLDPAARRLHVTVASAFDNAPLASCRMEAAFLTGAAGDVPRGAVGLVAAHDGDVGELLREMAQHYEHYRTQAIAHSECWRAKHAPQRTIDSLSAAVARVHAA